METKPCLEKGGSMRKAKEREHSEKGRRSCKPEEIAAEGAEKLPGRQTGTTGRLKNRALFLFFIYLLCLLARYYQMEQQSHELDELAGRGCEVSGRIIQQKKQGSGYEYHIQSEAITFEEKIISSHLKFQFYSPQSISINSRVKVAGQLALFQLPKNPGEWNKRNYYKAKNIYYHLKKAELLSAEAAEKSLVQEARHWVEKQSRLFLPEKERHLFISLFSGDRSELEPELTENFKKSGISHVLAVSGLHVGLLIMLLNIGLKRLPLPYGAQLFLMLAVLFGYVLFTGGQASILRAVLMFAIMEGAYFLDRAKDPKRAYAAALLILLFYNPFYLYDIGFLLSFISVGAILFLYPFLLADKPRPIQMAGLTVVLQIALLPLFSLYFYQFSLVAVLANLWVVPAISCFLASSVVALIFSSISLTLARLAVGGGYYAAQVGLWLTDWLAELPFSSVPIRAMQSWEIILFYGIILAALISRRKKLLWGLLFSLVIFIPYTWQPRLIMLDVGQAESMVVEYRNKTIVIDTGLASNKSTAAYLRYRGKYKIDMLLLSHLDQDHAGGLSRLLEDYEVGSIGISAGYRELTQEEAEILGMEKVRASYLQLKKLAQGRGIPLLYWQAGDYFEIAELQFRFLYPAAEERIFCSNDFSWVAEMRYGATAVLFTGDIGEEVEALLLERGLISQATVLKTAHHGSKNSSGAEFLERVKPALAIISCGEYNRYGHPSPLLLQELRKGGAEIRVTAWDGAIDLRFSRNREVIIDE